MTAQPSQRIRDTGLELVLIMLTIGIVSIALLMHRTTTVTDQHGHVVRALPDLRIDVNSADEAELILLPGIGPRLSERIVLDRATHGPFEGLDDLQRVRMIGPVTVQRIEPLAFAGSIDEPE